MGAPLVIYNEAQSFTALRTVLVALVCPPHGPVAPVDVYRARPAATAATGALGSASRLSVTFFPTTAIPVDDSWQGDEAAFKQKQKVQVLVTGVQAVTSFTVLGELVAYPLQVGDGPAEIAAGLLDALLLLGLPVTASVVDVVGVPAVEILADVAGVSLNVQPVAGSLSKITVDDNTRSAAWNWSSLTVRIVTQDVVDAAGNSRATAIAEKIRRALQAESWPLTPGVAYPYIRDVLDEGNLGYEQCLGPPVVLDGIDGGVQVRRVGLDVVFRPTTGVTLDVPSLDVIGFQPPVILDP